MSAAGGGGLNPINVEINPVVSNSSVNRLRNSIQKSFIGLKMDVSNDSIKKIQNQIGSISAIKLKFDPAQGQAYVREANAFFASNPVKIKINPDVSNTTTNSIAKVSKEIDKIKAASRSAELAVGSLSDITGDAADSFGTFAQRLGFTTTRLAAYLVPASLIFQATRGISIATRDIIEINRELVKLTQVLDGNASQANEIADSLLEFGASIGVSGKELLGLSVTLAQAGQLFSGNSEAIIRTSEALGKTQLLATFGNLADTTEGLIAILSQFNLTASDTNRIIDITNEVSKRFAVESSDIFTAVTSGGAAFSALGGSFEEFTAIVTTLRQQTRLSASTIGTGINTIVQRLFRPTSIEFLRTIGVNAVDAEGRLKNFVDVLTEVSIAIQKVDEVTKQLTFETLFGTRQGKLGIALVGDLGRTQSITRQALETSSTAIGSAAKDIEQGLTRVDVQLQRVATGFQQAFLDIAKDESFRSFIKDVADGLLVIANITKALSTTIVPSLISTGFFALLGATARSLPDILKGLSFTEPGTFGQVRNRRTRVVGGRETTASIQPFAINESSFISRAQPGSVISRIGPSIGGFSSSGTVPNINSIVDQTRSALAGAISSQPTVLNSLIAVRRRELASAVNASGFASIPGQQSFVASSRSLLIQEQAATKLANRLNELNAIVNDRKATEAEVNRLIAQRSEAQRRLERTVSAPIPRPEFANQLQRQAAQTLGVDLTPDLTEIRNAQQNLSSVEQRLSESRKRLSDLNGIISSTNIPNEIQRLSAAYDGTLRSIDKFASALDPRAGDLSEVLNKARAIVDAANRVERTSAAASTVINRNAAALESARTRSRAISVLTAAGAPSAISQSRIDAASSQSNAIFRNINSALSLRLSDTPISPDLAPSGAIQREINNLQNRLDEIRNRSSRINKQFSDAINSSQRQNILINDEIKARVKTIRDLGSNVIRPLYRDALNTGDVSAYNAAVTERSRLLSEVRGLRTQREAINSEVRKSTNSFTELNRQLAADESELIKQYNNLQKDKVNQFTRQLREERVAQVNNSILLNSARNIRGSFGALIRSFRPRSIGRFVRNNPAAFGVAGFTAAGFAANQLSGIENTGSQNVQDILRERDASVAPNAVRSGLSSAVSLGAAGFFIGGPTAAGIGAAVGLIKGAIEGVTEAYENSAQRLRAVISRGLFNQGGSINENTIGALNRLSATNRVNFGLGDTLGGFLRSGTLNPLDILARSIERRNRTENIGSLANTDQVILAATQAANRLVESRQFRASNNISADIVVGSASFTNQFRAYLASLNLNKNSIDILSEALLRNRTQIEQEINSRRKLTKQILEDISSLAFKNVIIDATNSISEFAKAFDRISNSISIGTEKIEGISRIAAGQGGQIIIPGAAEKQEFTNAIKDFLDVGNNKEFFASFLDRSSRDIAEVSVLAGKVSKDILSAVSNFTKQSLSEDAENISVRTALENAIINKYKDEINSVAFGKNLELNLRDFISGLTDNNISEEQIKSGILKNIEAPIGQLRTALEARFDIELKLREQFNARLKFTIDNLEAQLDLNRQRASAVFDISNLTSRRLSDSANLNRIESLTNAFVNTPQNLLNSANRVSSLRFSAANQLANRGQNSILDRGSFERDSLLSSELANAEVLYRDQIEKTRSSINRLTDQFNRLNEAVRINIANLQTTGRSSQGEIFAAQQTLRGISGGGLLGQLGQLGLNSSTSVSQFLSGLDPNDPRVRALVSRIANSPGEVSRISQAAGVLPGATTGVGTLSNINEIISAIRGAAFSGVGDINTNFAENIDQLKNINNKADETAQRIVDLQNALFTANQQLITTNESIGNSILSAITANFNGNEVANAFKNALKETVIKTRVEGDVNIEATITGLEAVLTSGNVVNTVAIIGLLDAIADTIPNNANNADVIRSIRSATKSARDKLKGNSQ